MPLGYLNILFGQMSVHVPDFKIGTFVFCFRAVRLLYGVMWFSVFSLVASAFGVISKTPSPDCYWCLLKRKSFNGEKFQPTNLGSRLVCAVGVLHEKSFAYPTFADFIFF